jgi:hypothetical protein
MKLHNIATIILIGVGVAYGQNQPTIVEKQPFPTDNRPVSAEEWRLKLVARLMSLPGPVTNGAMQLYGMGDEAAADVVKILSEKPSPTSSEIQSALDILHMAFAHPEAISKPENQKPQAAVFLLRYFSSMTGDVSVKERLEQETVFMQTAALRGEALRQKSLSQVK